MRALPASPDLSNLKKQAKRLLRGLRAGEPSALARVARSLPEAKGLDPAALAAREPRLHDAQSVVAREYGFRSWPELSRYVAWARADRAARAERWLTWVLEGSAADRRLAVRTLREEPAFVRADPWLACAAGDVAAIQAASARDPGWIARRGGPRAMPPLALATQSRLIREPDYEAPLLAAARLLLAKGADPNAAWIDPRFPDSPLSALYGAAGVNHHAGMTALLLEAGADPNDGESLYHSVESRDPACTTLLLDAGARVPGSNALARVLDYDDLDRLTLLLRRGGDARERPCIHHALLRGRSLAHVRALLEAGADPRARDALGTSVCRYALRLGRADVAALLRAAGVEEPLAEADAFVAACARGDEAAARTHLAADRTIIERLDEEALQMLPRLADLGEREAVRTMLALGWPPDVRTAWDATGLNLAVFRGDAATAGLFLAHGADWRARHGFGDTVIGTLSFASRSDEIDPAAPRDYAACARALLTGGVPREAFAGSAFAPEVADVLAGEAAG